MHPTTKTFGDACPEAFTPLGLKMVATWHYRPFEARWTGDDGRAELSPGDQINESTTPEFRQRVKSETTWVEQPREKPTWSTLDLARRKEVANCRMVCPCCYHGNEYPVYVGKDMGIEITTFRRCMCRTIQDYLRIWRRDVPERFQDCALSSLAPSPLSKLALDRQQKVIDHLKQHPTDSYLLVGDGEIGKTHWSFALHQHALALWANHAYRVTRPYEPTVLRAKVPELMKEHHAWALRSHQDVPEPSITIRKIKAITNQGSRPTVILDEIDKIGSITDPKLTVMYDIVDACYEAKGQIIATSNVDAETLKHRWSKGQDEWVAQMTSVITRRIGTGEGAHTIEVRI